MMSQAEFSRLCGVTPMMVTKYKQNGLISMAGGKVDPHASLKSLAGRLDEEKRQAALKRLQSVEAVKTDAAASTGPAETEAAQPPPAPAPKEPAEPSWKVKKDRAEAQMRQLDLAERQGLLVDAAEVHAAIEDVVQTHWSVLERRQSKDTENFGMELGLDFDQQQKLRKLMRDLHHDFRRDFSAAMKAAADELAPSGKKAR